MATKLNRILWLIAIIGTLNILDYTTTMVVLRLGVGVESNPLVPRIGTLETIIKLVVIPALFMVYAYADFQAEKEKAPKIRKILYVVGLFVMLCLGLTVLNNTAVLIRGIWP